MGDTVGTSRFVGVTVVVGETDIIDASETIEVTTAIGVDEGAEVADTDTLSGTHGLFFIVRTDVSINMKSTIIIINVFLGDFCFI